MNKKSTVKRIIAMALCLTLVFGMSACGKKKEVKEEETTEETKAVQVQYDTKASSVKKSETVYVNLANDGTVKRTSVTDWIHTDEKNVYVDDVSSLKNIKNVKGDIEPVKTENGIRWNMNSTDLYYSGTTNKPLPVSISLKYYLNGKEMSAKDIAGKSGTVTIAVNTTNNSYVVKKIDGKKQKVYLPVIVMGGTIFEESKFSDITIDNGKSIGDGTKQIAVITTLPGFSESLGLDKIKSDELDELKIPSSAKITVKTDSFELGNMYFAVVPLCSLDLDIVVPDTLEELKGDMTKINKLMDSVSQLDIKSLTSTLSSGMAKVDDITGMLDDAVSLYNKNAPLLNVLSKYMTDANLKKINKLLDDMDDKQIQQAMELLSNPILQKFIKNLPNLVNDLEEVTPLIDSLQKDLSDPEVAAALDGLPETLKQLQKLKKGLDDNKDLIQTLSDLSSSDLVSVMKDISESMSDADLEKTFSKYSGVLDDADGLVAKAKAWLQYGESYDIYTEAAKSTQTNVMFVYQTQSITANTSENNTEETTESVPWYKKIFQK